AQPARPAESKLPAGASSSLLADLRVLVVDDDPSARELLSKLLHGYGAEVILADSGPAALTQLFAHKPHVLIADLGMPEMDGYALIEQVRSLDPDFGGRTPAIAVTAYASVQDRLRALQAGYQNHVGKPVEPEELAIVIASLTGRAATCGARAHND
ncbi:MAG TPA: response regulator, partial [Steroidobacteraceae bacterium]